MSREFPTSTRGAGDGAEDRAEPAPSTSLAHPTREPPPLQVTVESHAGGTHSMFDRTARLPRKVLIQMSGAPGSGKSTLANLVARSIDGVVINHDLIKAFFLDNDIPFDQSSKLTYRFDWILAEDIIRQGRSVVIDSICNYNAVLDQGIALAQKYDYDYRYVECRVNDIDLLDQRLRNRAPMRSQRLGVNHPPPDSSACNREDPRARFRKWIENPCRPDGAAIIVDSTGSPEECLDLVLKQIIPSREG